MDEDKRTVNPQIVRDIVAAVRSTKNIYFKGKHILSNNFAGDIVFDKFDPNDFSGINRGFIVLDAKDIYIYYDGYYHPEGKEVIETVARIIMGDKAKNQNVTEVVTAVKQMLGLSVKIRDIQSKYKNMVCLKNGVLNVATGELLPHSKEYYLIEQMNLDYNKDSKCPNFLKFVGEILAPDDVLVIQELLGYILYKVYKYPNFFLFVGNGRNGKTTLLNFIKTFIGSDSMTSFSLYKLTTSQFSMANLFGKLANISGDIGATSISDTSILKILTGGDEITERRFHQDYIKFVNYAKLIFAANNPPEFPEDKTEAFASRLTFLEFNSYFPLGDPKTDPDLIDKITTPEELSGVLNWAIDGLHRLLKNKKFSYNKSTEDNLRKYEERANPMQGFCNENFELKLGCFVSKTEVAVEWEKYCVKHKKPVLNEVHFNRRFYSTLAGASSTRINLPNKERIFMYKNVAWKDPSKKTYTYDDFQENFTQQTIETQNKTLDNEPVDITIGDKINSLKVFLEDNPATFDELNENGFDNDFLNMCIDRNIIIKRPDGRYVLNG